MISPQLSVSLLLGKETDRLIEQWIRYKNFHITDSWKMVIFTEGFGIAEVWWMLGFLDFGF